MDEDIQKGNTTLDHGSLESQAWTWQCRLGHPSLAKSHKHSYPSSFNKIAKPFVLFHSDVWGPAPQSASN